MLINMADTFFTSWIAAVDISTWRQLSATLSTKISYAHKKLVLHKSALKTKGIFGANYFLTFNAHYVKSNF